MWCHGVPWASASEDEALRPVVAGCRLSARFAEPEAGIADNGKLPVKSGLPASGIDHHSLLWSICARIGVMTKGLSSLTRGNAPKD